MKKYIIFLAMLLLLVGFAQSLELKSNEKIYISLVNSTDGNATAGQTCKIGIFDSSDNHYVNGSAMTDELDGRYSYDIGTTLTGMYTPYTATVNCTYGSYSFTSFRQFYYVETRTREEMQNLAHQDNITSLLDGQAGISKGIEDNRSDLETHGDVNWINDTGVVVNINEDKTDYSLTNHTIADL